MVRYRHKETGKVIGLNEILDCVAIRGNRAEFIMNKLKKVDDLFKHDRVFAPLEYEILVYKAIDIPNSPDFELVKEVEEITKRDLVDILHHLPPCRVKEKVHRIVWNFAGREEGDNKPW